MVEPSHTATVKGRRLIHGGPEAVTASALRAASIARSRNIGRSMAASLLPWIRLVRRDKMKALQMDADRMA